MTFACHRCKADPQPEHFGSPRRCAFNDEGRWRGDNWNCATITLLRRVAYDEETAHRRSDESVGFFDRHFFQDEDPSHIVLTYYKDRGRTHFAYYMDGENELHLLTYEVAERAAEYAIDAGYEP